jgi:RNA recognition motif-containing protein
MKIVFATQLTDP